MKKLLTSFILILSLSMAAKCQNAKLDQSGNYTAIKKVNDSVGNNKNTGKTFTDTKGNVYAVYVSERGKLFYLKTAKTSGNEYKVYLKL